MDTNLRIAIKNEDGKFKTIDAENEDEIVRRALFGTYKLKGGSIKDEWAKKTVGACIKAVSLNLRTSAGIPKDNGDKDEILIRPDSLTELRDIVNILSESIQIMQQNHNYIPCTLRYSGAHTKQAQVIAQSRINGKPMKGAPFKGKPMNYFDDLRKICKEALKSKDERGIQVQNTSFELILNEGVKEEGGAQKEFFLKKIDNPKNCAVISLMGRPKINDIYINEL